MPNRLALDLSHWNTVADWAAIAAAGIVGVIHKASEGDYNTDATYAERRRAAESAGLVWGAYHFGTSDDVTAQVDRFLSVVGLDLDDMLLALDFEDYGDKSMSLDQARQWIEQVENRTRRPGGVVLYSGNRVKDLLGNKIDPFFAARRLWLAQYGSTPKPQASWSSAWLWQFTDGTVGPEPHTCPGVTGGVDGNSFAGPISTMIAQWSGVPLMPEPVPPEPEPITITLGVPRGTRVEIIEL